MLDADDCYVTHLTTLSFKTSVCMKVPLKCISLVFSWNTKRRSNCTECCLNIYKSLQLQVEGLAWLQKIDLVWYKDTTWGQSFPPDLRRFILPHPHFAYITSHGKKRAKHPQWIITQRLTCLLHKDHSSAANNSAPAPVPCSAGLLSTWGRRGFILNTCSHCGDQVSWTPCRSSYSEVIVFWCLVHQ